MNTYLDYDLVTFDTVKPCIGVRKRLYHNTFMECWYAAAVSDCKITQLNRLEYRCIQPTGFTRITIKSRCYAACINTLLPSVIYLTTLFRLNKLRRIQGQDECRIYFIGLFE